MTPRTPAIDTHAHVFDRTCGLVPGRRYTPDYEAPVQDYLDRLDRAGIAGGVLVQPSFLGTDNSYLLFAIRQHPQRLAGIAVVDPSISDTALSDLSNAGIRGLRYNLFGQDPDLIRQPRYRALTARAKALDWLVELHTPGPTLPKVLDCLLADGGRIVVHHFGRPETASIADDPALRALLGFGPRDRVWVKLSAPYRLAGIDPHPIAAALLQQLGPDRLLWGSDWPWTQHESEVNFDRCIAQIRGWLGDDPSIWDRFDQTSRRLYGFAQ